MSDALAFTGRPLYVPPDLRLGSTSCDSELIKPLTTILRLSVCCSTNHIPTPGQVAHRATKNFIFFAGGFQLGSFQVPPTKFLLWHVRLHDYLYSLMLGTTLFYLTFGAPTCQVTLGLLSRSVNDLTAEAGMWRPLTPVSRSVNTWSDNHKC